MYSKFFDNKGALPHHLHQMEEHAAAVGQKPKPEAYYFAPQMNNYGANFPYTFFGLEPGTTKDQVRTCLEAWDQGDNGIRYLSKAYRLELGTGWYVPSGLLHAPGSLCTYEPQWASDVFAMFQSLVNEELIAWDMLVKDVPDDKKNDLDYIISMVDWEANVNPNIKQAYYRPPLPVRPLAEMESDGLCREVDHLRQRLHCGQGADRTAGRQRDHPRCRSLRLHHGAGARQGRTPVGGDAVADPLRPALERRVLRVVRRSAGGRHHQQPQHDRSSGHAQTFRTEPRGARRAIRPGALGMLYASAACQGSGPHDALHKGQLDWG